ncbi:MAG: MBL fold metallo-hydrolase, partial [Thermoguttaceae bacterium]|nr:MBL fold metallo-hydrolase [Thermoguttaceae bacterium]
MSGSSGNATYIASGKTRILVDCGRSGRQLEECLENIGVDARTLTHIFITHSHTDHTTGAGVLSRRYDIPIYCTLGTWNEMARKKVPGDVAGKNIQLFQSAQPDKTITLDDLQIVFFPLPHDTSDPVGYRISDGKATVAIATDIGYVSSHVHHYLMGADVVLLESNHDVRMLKNGSYTELLKARILSRTGHLSNESAGEFSAELI